MKTLFGERNPTRPEVIVFAVIAVAAICLPNPPVNSTEIMADGTVHAGVINGPAPVSDGCAGICPPQRLTLPVSAFFFLYPIKICGKMIKT